MNLRQVIEELAKLPQDKVVKEGFKNPHSWRGAYDMLAFEPALGVTVGSMIEAAMDSDCETFTGWKGGEFTMYLTTECHLDNVGSASDEDGRGLEELIRSLSGELEMNQCDGCNSNMPLREGIHYIGEKPSNVCTKYLYTI